MTLLSRLFSCLPCASNMEHAPTKNYAWGDGTNASKKSTPPSARRNMIAPASPTIVYNPRSNGRASVTFDQDSMSPIQHRLRASVFTATTSSVVYPFDTTVSTPSIGYLNRQLTEFNDQPIGANVEEFTPDAVLPPSLNRSSITSMSTTALAKRTSIINSSDRPLEVDAEAVVPDAVASPGLNRPSVTFAHLTAATERASSTLATSIVLSQGLASSSSTGLPSLLIGDSKGKVVSMDFLVHVVNFVPEGMHLLKETSRAGLKIMGQVKNFIHYYLLDLDARVMNKSIIELLEKKNLNQAIGEKSKYWMPSLPLLSHLIEAIQRVNYANKANLRIKQLENLDEREFKIASLSNLTQQLLSVSHEECLNLIRIAPHILKNHTLIKEKVDALIRDKIEKNPGKNAEDFKEEAIILEAKGIRHAIHAMSLAERAAVKTLDLSRLGLTSIPRELFLLQNLESLNLSHNQLIAISPEIRSLCHLKHLALDHNRLTTFPAEIGSLSKLGILSATHNLLKTLSPSIRKLSCLKELYLSYNELAILPSGVASLFQLKRLKLDHNQLVLFPRIEFLSHLVHLDLSYNQLLAFQFQSQSNLEYLDLSHNQLMSFSSTGSLFSLKYLNLAHNDLRAFPSPMKSFPQLRILILNHNHFPIVPADIDILQHLEQLDLSKSSLLVFEPSKVELLIKWLPNLKELLLDVGQVNSPIPAIAPLRFVSESSDAI